MSEPTQNGWYFVDNSWQYTTVYDADGVPICQLDLKDWGVTEDNQARLERLQTSYAHLIADAWTIPALREALEDIKELTDTADQSFALAEIYRISTAALITPENGNG